MVLASRYTASRAGCDSADESRRHLEHTSEPLESQIRPAASALRSSSELPSENDRGMRIPHLGISHGHFVRSIRSREMCE